MKVGIVARDLGTEKGGGVFNVIRELSYGIPQKDKDNQYYIFTTADLEIKGAKVVKIPAVHPAIWDHFLVPLYAYKAGVKFLVAAKNTVPLLWLRKSIVCLYDLAYFDKPHYYKWYQSIYMMMIMTWGVLRASRVVTISKYSKRRIEEIFRFLARGKTECIYLSIDKEFYNPPEPSKEHIEQFNKNLKKPYVLIVGGIQPRKNHIGLVNAMKILWEKGIDLDLVIVGKKSVKHEQVLSQIEAELRHRVHITGYVDLEYKLLLYQKAFVYAYPSFYEGFGIPLLEAFSMSCPVVTSNRTSLPEVAGNAAIVVEPTPEGIAEGIEKIYEDENLRESLIQKGHERLKMFSWDQIIEDYIKVINQYT